jgi:DNA modification methylase
VNKIICGDSLTELKKMADESVDLTITSPPYDNLRLYGSNYVFDFKNTAKELFRTTKQGGVVVWVVGDQTINGSETGSSFKQALFFKEIGFNLHDTMIYNKGKCIYPNPKRYHQVFEYMFILSKGSPKTINLIKDRKNKWSQSWGKRTFRQKDGTLKQKDIIKLRDFGVRFNIWQINNGFMHTTLDKFAFEHPAMFPEALARDHIVSWSNKGDIVLDPMMGSGTTGKMAKILGRSFIGIEIEPKYFKIAQRRINNTQESLF